MQIDRIPLLEICAVNIQGWHHKDGWFQRCRQVKQRCMKAFTCLSESSEDKPVDLSWSAREKSGTQGSIKQDRRKAMLRNSASIISMAVRDSTKAEEMCDCVIQTVREGFNAGRCCRFRTETEEQAIDLVDKIRKCSDEAIGRNLGHGSVAFYQRRTKIFYNSDEVQLIVATLIVFAFTLSILDVEIRANVSEEETERLMKTFDVLERIVTLVFTVELLTNMFACGFPQKLLICSAFPLS